MKNRNDGWSTKDECDAIAYLASGEVREKELLDGRQISYTPTLKQRRDKLRTWLRHAETRTWKNNINVIECQRFCLSQLQALDGVMR
jgi:hypothetical protein